jgi:hypothetical protein
MAKPKVTTSGYIPSSGGVGDSRFTTSKPNQGVSISQASVESANKAVEKARAKVQAAKGNPLKQAKAMIALNEAKITAAQRDLAFQTQKTTLDLTESKALQTQAADLIAQTKSDAAALASRIGGTTVSTPDGRGLYVVPPTASQRAVISDTQLDAATGKNELVLATLRELGLPESMLQPSLDFINYAMADGLKESEAISIFYNNKSFTTKNGLTIESPFYKEFTYLREYAPKTGRDIPTPKELMAFKLGVKDLVAKTGRSSIYASEESIQKFISNGVKITDLDVRFAEYGVAALAADPNKVATLKQLGYIKDSQGLIDFYADPTIGQKQFEINQKTSAFAQQALQRASAGIIFDANRMKQLAALSGSTDAGVGVGTVESTASKAFQTIADTLKPATMLSGIYERGAASTEAERLSMVQSELESEQFMGMPSSRIRRLKEQNIKGFQGEAGTTSGSFRGPSSGLV